MPRNYIRKTNRKYPAHRSPPGWNDEHQDPLRPTGRYVSEDEELDDAVLGVDRGPFDLTISGSRLDYFIPDDEQAAKLDTLEYELRKLGFVLHRVPSEKRRFGFTRTRAKWGEVLPITYDKVNSYLHYHPGATAREIGRDLGFGAHAVQNGLVTDMEYKVAEKRVISAIHNMRHEIKRIKRYDHITNKWVWTYYLLHDKRTPTETQLTANPKFAPSFVPHTSWQTKAAALLAKETGLPAIKALPIIKAMLRLAYMRAPFANEIDPSRVNATEPDT